MEPAEFCYLLEAIAGIHPTGRMREKQDPTHTRKKKTGQGQVLAEDQFSDVGMYVCMYVSVGRIGG